MEMLTLIILSINDYYNIYNDYDKAEDNALQEWIRYIKSHTATIIDEVQIKKFINLIRYNII